MSPEQIEILAMNNKPMPDNLSPPQVMLFQTMAALYARYRTGIISREQGRKNKSAILCAYQRMNNEYEQFLAICREYQKRIVNGYDLRRNKDDS